MGRIALDAIGGDHGPAEVVKGVALALQRGHVRAEDLILVGAQAAVRQAIDASGSHPDLTKIDVVDAPDLLTPGDTPIDAMRRKPRNSIAVALELVKTRRAGAFVSAGSTGTVVASATLGLGCLRGIRRPAISAIIHGEKNPFLVLDVGANPQPKALHMAQYAIMGSAYYGGTFGVDKPKVGILNIGSEELKGSPLVKESRALIKDLPINFHGNIEGDELFSGACHVVICDGFVGNVLLKVSEGLAEYVLRAMTTAMGRVGVEETKIHKVLQTVMPQVDYSEYGGALLLGVDGIVTICHGRSEAPAFCNAIRFAQKALSAEVNRHIVEDAGKTALEGNAESLPPKSTA